MPTGVTINLESNVILVTGGSRGIGAACCRILAQAGASVVLNHSRSERGRKAAYQVKSDVEAMNKGQIMIEEADVGNYEEVKEMFNHIIARYGKIDTVVCNAGITSPVPLERLEPEIWEKTLRINLTGAFHVVRQAIPIMLAQKKGVFIIIGSSATYTGGGGGAHYSASKTGLEGLTRDINREYLRKGIRANTVLPAAIETDMFKERYPHPEDRKKAAEEHPLGRLGTPEDIANVVLFLASDLSEYICGQHILVDGGRTFFR